MSAFGIFLTSFLVYAFAVIAFDVWLIRSGHMSISWSTYLNAKKYPIVAFGFGLLVGVLAGHFFFEMC